MKIYAIIPVNEAAIELTFPESVPALFSNKAVADRFAAEMSIDGEEYAAEEVILNEDTE